ncbi:SsrA-binding protein SmpB [Patescibacteria group bacterium]|nr:SsrA-binding protein SmpB [Patescibacteria group bacterium]MBU1256715.1 SsrA-binding protein SmpB [Patescibacteria group bacterium]MBU1457676.1 SsrA-binding protein SmpB [Patescibacteria group bacterium]
MRLVNRKAKRDYEVIEAMEAGVVLTGGEVKSLRAGQGNLLGSRIMIKNGEVWISGLSIPRYKFASGEDEYEPDRLKKLLIKQKERQHLETKAKGGGLTMIPLTVYNKRGLIKVEIGLVRGKKKYEKREVLKKRKQKRDLARRFKT